MREFITLGLFIGSFAGLAYIIGRKVSVLLMFPVSSEQDPLKDAGRKTKEYIEALTLARWISSPELFQQKLLSKLRIIFLRMEGKTSEWLMSLRKKSQEKSQEQDERFSENYWKELKKK